MAEKLHWKLRIRRLSNGLNKLRVQEGGEVENECPSGGGFQISNSSWGIISLFLGGGILGPTGVACRHWQSVRIRKQFQNLDPLWSL